MDRKSALPLAAGFAAAALASTTVARFYRQRSEADRLWHEYEPRKFERPDSASALTVMPLIDFYTADDSLKGEAGVSYLVKADDTTLLFDVGFNRQGTSPSPLKQNMQALGVTQEEIDMVVISHRHVDHIGGIKAQRRRTFTLSPDDQDTLTVPAFVPDEMSHPSAKVALVTDPQRLAPGVFSIGPIARSIWLAGLTKEQGLAVNVEGKGIVLIIGCGHQTLERAIARTEALFDEPLYGVIGGLHFPVTGSRIPGGVQRVIGTGKPPWRPVTKRDVTTTIEHLAQKDPKLVAISAHDSCDWSISEFRSAFSHCYREVVVGEEIVV